MEWEEELQEGQGLLEMGLVAEAYEVASRLMKDPGAINDSGALRSAFHSACAVRATEAAETVANILALSTDDEDQFTAASWWESLAADAYAEGKLEEARELLEKCFATAPQHRAADGRQVHRVSGSCEGFPAQRPPLTSSSGSASSRRCWAVQRCLTNLGRGTKCKKAALPQGGAAWKS